MMGGERLEIAHLTIFDVTVLVVFAPPAVDHESLYKELIALVSRTDPGSEVALVWQGADGMMRFLVPLPQQRFFEAMKYDQLHAQVDGTITLTPA